MSKRQFKKYLGELKKKALEEQLLDLYERYPLVKEYYDFAFNPKEEKLLQEAKAKISNEYFPVRRKRPKARRSVAQKFIKHYMKLGVEPFLIADLMLYNLEIAQTFSINRNLPDSFFKSMLNSFSEVVHYVAINGLLVDYRERLVKIYQLTQDHHWPFEEDFSRALDAID